MRLIHQVIWALFKMLFDIDMDAPAARVLPSGERETLERLLEMVDSGRVGEAEDIVFDIADAGNRADAALVLLFFSHLNDKPDAFLEEHGFTREELADDLKTILAKYDLSGMAQMLLPQDD